MNNVQICENSESGELHEKFSLFLLLPQYATKNGISQNYDDSETPLILQKPHQRGFKTEIFLMVNKALDQNQITSFQNCNVNFLGYYRPNTLICSGGFTGGGPDVPHNGPNFIYFQGFLHIYFGKT